MNDPIVFLPLSMGQVAIIDFADFELVGRFKWHAAKRGKTFYAQRNAGGRENHKMPYLHCEILGVTGVDHKNGNGLDCRRENLRPATKRQNSRAFRRKKVRTSSLFRGVSWVIGRSKWEAQIFSERQKFFLGYFTDEIDAARAYDTKAKELGFFKEALNFP